MEDKKQIEWYDDVYFLYIFSSIDARMKSEKEYQLPQYAPSPFKKLPSIQGRIRSFELKIVWGTNWGVECNEHLLDLMKFTSTSSILLMLKTAVSGQTIPKQT